MLYEAEIRLSRFDRNELMDDVAAIDELLTARRKRREAAKAVAAAEQILQSEAA